MNDPRRGLGPFRAVMLIAAVYAVMALVLLGLAEIGRAL